MPDLRVKRTLVKSPPELWAELSEVESLARHLGEFGEITISRLEPERTVAWEGKHARGTVELESSGWGTKVTLTAEIDAPPPVVEDPTEAAPEAELAPMPQPEPEPELTYEPGPELTYEPELTHEPEPELTYEPEPEPAEEPAEPEPAARKRRGFISRWLFLDRGGHTVPAPPAPAPEPVTVAEPEPHEPEPELEPEVELETEPDELFMPADPEPAAEADFEYEFDFAPRHPIQDEATPGMETVEESAPAEPVIAVERAEAVLEAALESLGQAHHRPFSRG